MDKFLIENAVYLENLKEENLICVEKLCEDYEKIELNDRKLELFLNGVRLTVSAKDGVYSVYHKQKFVGLGVVEMGLLKRDVIIN